jgi:hypothetical protein
MILGMNVTRDKAAGTITLSQKDAIAAAGKYAEHMPREVTVPSQPGSAHQLCSGGQRAQRRRDAGQVSTAPGKQHTA